MSEQQQNALYPVVESSSLMEVFANAKHASSYKNHRDQQKLSLAFFSGKSQVSGQTGQYS